MTPTTAGDGDRPAPARPAPGPLDYARKAVKALASLRLTVVLFAFSIGLVFLGTLAQMEFGIWTVVEQYFWSWFVWVPTDLFRQFGSVFLSEWFPKDGPRWTATFPFPAGKLLGGLMLVNLLAAHLVRFRLTWKRSGVLLIHSGLILLFAGEFVTREYAVEQSMRIRQGKTADYTEDTRHVELAFVDSSDPSVDHVVVIPARLLRAGGKISDPQLPVDVEVVDYFTNSALELAKGGKANPATAGVGKGLIAVRRPDVSGVDPNQKIDLPVAYVRLTDKATGADLGTYLVALRISLEGGHDDVTAGGKTYRMNLRNVRYPKPYSVELHEFRFDRYPGTQKAKNFSSEVTVRNDKGEVEVQHQIIKMNDPLRYAGETFYQSSFDPDENGTVLQVVKNPGWLIPYISCVIVSLGMLVHFGIYLTGFLLRRTRTTRAAGTPVPSGAGPAGRPTGWYLPGLCVAVVVLYAVAAFARMSPPKQPFNLDAFGQLPVLDGGRVKPLDSSARVYLRYISGQSDFKDTAGETRPAIQWYLETLAADPFKKTQPVWDYRIVRIDNEQVLAQLKFVPREGLRYSVNELRPNIPVIQKNGVTAAQKRDAGGKLTVDETKWLELLERLSLIWHVAEGKGHDTRENKFHLLPPQTPGGSWQSLGELKAEAEAAAYAKALETARARVKGRPGGFGSDDEKALLGKIFGPDLPQVPEEQKQTILNVLFSADPGVMRDEKMKEEVLKTVLSELPPDQQAAIQRERAAAADAALDANPVAKKWEEMIAARRSENGEAFNRLLADYREHDLAQLSERTLAKVRLETMYNRFNPFYRLAWWYGFAFVLAILGFLFTAGEKPAWGEALRRSAAWVLYANLIVHTGALLVRMSLMDRPFVFVTNLYSSAVFIGWGCVALGLVLERIYRIGVGNIVSSVLGLATTIVALNLATDDTLEMLQAVLDTNFWLATHVTTVTLGYTATFVAGFLGIVYVVQVLATVVRDGFLDPKPASPGALLAFGAAAAGVVGIPLFLLWFVSTALVAKFEWVHSSIPTVMLVVTAGAAAFYAGGLLMLKAGETGTDPNGRPALRQLPAAARPLAGMALTPEGGKVLGQMIYGVVCFATLLSFVGTVLGGIWADQSWGRFWGWDPKENGAVLIVLWNSLILHARWCGLVKDRGVAVLTLGGNMICAWSWFGTNQLGIGLHAYGFDTRLADGCTNFWLSQLVVIGLGLIPREYWASATRRPAAQPAPEPPPAPKRKSK